MKRIALAAVLLTVSVPTAWALRGGSSDGLLAHRLILSKTDADPLFPGFIGPWSRNPCPLTITAADQMTARAAGNWGGIQIGLWSTAVVMASPGAAERLYKRLVASQPGCLLQAGRIWGKAAHIGYTHPCPGASIHRLDYGPYGDARQAWRATYYTRYQTGCTARALDGVIVRTGRAVAIYTFDNARAFGRNGALVSTRDEHLVKRAIARATA